MGNSAYTDTLVRQRVGTGVRPGTSIPPLKQTNRTYDLSYDVSKSILDQSKKFAQNQNILYIGQKQNSVLKSQFYSSK